MYPEDPGIFNATKTGLHDSPLNIQKSSYNKSQCQGFKTGIHFVHLPPPFYYHHLILFIIKAHVSIYIQPHLIYLKNLSTIELSCLLQILNTYSWLYRRWRSKNTCEWCRMGKKSSGKNARVMETSAKQGKGKKVVLTKLSSMGIARSIAVQTQACTKRSNLFTSPKWIVIF